MIPRDPPAHPTVDPDRIYRNNGNVRLLALPGDRHRRVLDVGCGAGDNAMIIRRDHAGCSVEGITHSETEARIAGLHMDRCWVFDIERDFPPEFGYNNVRVPLYLIRAGLDHSGQLERLGMIFDESYAPAIIDVTTGERIEPMGEAGYRIIGAARACVLYGTPIPPELQAFSPQSYYGATMHLLTLAHLRQRHNECLAPENAEGQS